MYGDRGRIGLIVPSSNTTNEPEFAGALPSGVSLHAARMRLDGVDADSLSAMVDDVERCADLLTTADVDVVAYGCTTGSLVHGPGYDEEIEARIEEAAGVPAVATAASAKRAFDALDADSLAVTTPYVDGLNEREAAFLDAAGYDVVAMRGLGIGSNTDIGAQTPETAADAGARRTTPRPTRCSSPVRTTAPSRWSPTRSATSASPSSRAIRRRCGTRSGTSTRRSRRRAPSVACSTGRRRPRNRALPGRIREI